MKSARSTLFRTAALTMTAPLTLALAACGDTEAAEGGAIAGEPIAAIEAPEGTSWLETVNVTADGQGFIVGNPDAPLKLAEYASHTCGACANFSQTGKAPLKEYVKTGVVSFEQREVFLNTFDVVIATLAQCGPPQQFQTLSDEVWQNFQPVMQAMQADQAGLQAAGGLPPEQRFVRLGEVTGLIDFFAARGLSADQARTCLADAAKIEKMTETVNAKAVEVDVQGTPTFTLNGGKVDALNWGQLEPILQKAGAREAE